jgi:glycosyltransferase involved in cell wall biosynthesis
LVAGFVSVFWGKVFGKRVITTTHSIYSFPEKGIYKEFAKWIFKSSDAVLTLSKQSKEEMVRLGIDQSKVNVFTYWVDLDKFKTISNAKQKLKWENKFIILFVGRLVKEKGILVLLDAVKMLDKNITLAIAGTGPLEKLVTNYQSLVTNLVYLGKVDNDKLPLYYSAADFVIVPSVHEEGFGRVIIEALSCGKPVIASNRGAIPEAMDESVGKLIEITPENIKKAVEYFYYHPQYLKTLTSNSRPYAENKYSENNADMIIDAYY